MTAHCDLVKLTQYPAFYGLVMSLHTIYPGHGPRHLEACGK